MYPSRCLNRESNREKKKASAPTPAATTKYRELACPLYRDRRHDPRKPAPGWRQATSSQPSPGMPADQGPQPKHLLCPLGLHPAPPMFPPHPVALDERCHRRHIQEPCRIPRVWPPAPVFRRFLSIRWDHRDFNSRVVKDRHRTLDECCSPLRMLARNWVVNQRNTTHPIYPSTPIANIWGRAHAYCDMLLASKAFRFWGLSY